MVATVLGLLGTFMLVPARISDPRLSTVDSEANLIFSVPKELQGKIIRQVEISGSDKPIALTIDDGPWGDVSLQMLKILKQNQIKATFFWVGKNVQTYPDIARQVVADGHAIGNHTWHHWYYRMNPATAAAEIDNTNRVIYDTTGVKTSLFRPPGGYMHNGLVAYARSQNNAIMMWSAELGEFRIKSVPVYVNNVLKQAQPGAIVLMHDGGGNHKKSVQALPYIIEGLKKRGYRFVTVPELLDIQAKAIGNKAQVVKPTQHQAVESQR